MTYIIVLNYNGENDTIECVLSLINLVSSEYRIVVCDNFSEEKSYNKLKCYFSSEIFLRKSELRFVELDGHSLIEPEDYSGSKNIYLIKNNKNLGFSAGNNSGIKFALSQKDMAFVWLLNNDTQVDSNSLACLIEEVNSRDDIGICGSKLVYYNDRNKLQGIGGLYNKYMGCTSHYAEGDSIDSAYDKKIIVDKLDYVIGASFLITKQTLKNIGYLNEEYFLYFEELDYIARAKKVGINFSVALDSIVYHKEGASTGIKGKVKKPYIDYIEVRSRLIYAKKYNKKYFYFIKLFLFFVLFNRLKRFNFKAFFLISRLLFTYKLPSRKDE